MPASASVLLKVRKDHGGTRDASAGASPASNHLLVRGEANAAVALRCAALLASKAKGFKPTVYRTKTCSHCLGSC